MHKDGDKTIRDDHVENQVLVSKDIKHMQAVVETSALRRAECIEWIQAIHAEKLKPYRKSLEESPSGANEAKRKLYKNQSLFNSTKGKFKPNLGYSWLPDGNREEIEEWR